MAAPLPFPSPKQRSHIQSSKLHIHSLPIQYNLPQDIKLFTYGTVGGGLLSDAYYEEPKQGLMGKRRAPNHRLFYIHLFSLFRCSQLPVALPLQRQPCPVDCRPPGCWRAARAPLLSLLLAPLLAPA